MSPTLYTSRNNGKENNGGNTTMVTSITMINNRIWCRVLQSAFLSFVTFCTTDPTPSLSPLETLRRRIVDHQTLPVVCSLFSSGQFPSRPESSGTLPYVKSPLPYPWHFTCQRTPFNTCILTQDLRLQSCTEQIPYVQSSLSHVRLIYSTCYFYYSTCHL